MSRYPTPNTPPIIAKGGLDFEVEWYSGLTTIATNPIKQEMIAKRAGIANPNENIIASRRSISVIVSGLDSIVK